ncbi:hypothetical protein OEZ86_010040 [Tetradesmus obliquus]|uniref:RIIa domain-containing protein n=1 Tax=Tetradesmus obliquus TaxID=3088 RepID=A0ABY8UPF4_TETOB|nr:hypothetical protein OEZ85_001475 [Tetradesmus obliquus]WIA43593.1 hypothetical protein OEZ86_010040 [Tetradesmus obliquus]
MLHEVSPRRPNGHSSGSSSLLPIPAPPTAAGLQQGSATAQGKASTSEGQCNQQAKRQKRKAEDGSLFHLPSPAAEDQAARDGSPHNHTGSLLLQQQPQQGRRRLTAVRSQRGDESKNWANGDGQLDTTRVAGSTAEPHKHYNHHACLQQLQDLELEQAEAAAGMAKLVERLQDLPGEVQECLLEHFNLFMDEAQLQQQQQAAAASALLGLSIALDHPALSSSPQVIIEP